MDNNDLQKINHSNSCRKDAIIENDIEIQKVDKAVTSWLSNMIIINHKSIFYKIIRHTEILCCILSAHFYIYIANTFHCKLLNLKNGLLPARRFKKSYRSVQAARILSDRPVPTGLFCKMK